LQMYGTGTVPGTVRRKLKKEIPEIRPAEVYVYDLYVLTRHFATVKRFPFSLYRRFVMSVTILNITPSINDFNVFSKIVKSALLNSFVV
jgi:hypothetical protein